LCRASSTKKKGLVVMPTARSKGSYKKRVSRRAMARKRSSSFSFTSQQAQKWQVRGGGGGKAVNCMHFLFKEIEKGVAKGKERTHSHRYEDKERVESWREYFFWNLFEGL